MEKTSNFSTVSGFMVTKKEGGIVDALFIDDKRVRTGPPPSYEKIKKLIKKNI